MSRHLAMTPLTTTLSFLILTACFAASAEAPPVPSKAKTAEAGAAAKKPEEEVCYIQEWHVPLDLLKQLAGILPKNDVAQEGAKKEGDYPDWNGTKGSSAMTGKKFAVYSLSSGTLTVKDTQAQLDKIDALIKAHDAKLKKRKPAR